jgi:hypothetical protein
MIVDAEKAVYEVDDLYFSLKLLIETSIFECMSRGEGGKREREREIEEVSGYIEEYMKSVFSAASCLDFI